MKAHECPACGRTYLTRSGQRLSSIVTVDDETYVMVRRPLIPTRSVAHHCVPEPPARGPGDDAPVPSRPPRIPPTRTDAIALELPT